MSVECKRCKEPRCESEFQRGRLCCNTCRNVARRELYSRTHRRQPSTSERFAARHSLDVITGCWPWTARKNAKGYGVFKATGEVSAHRVSWVLFRGAIPAEMFVCHRCDNPSCVNPDHLFLGTHDDNMRDMVDKGRQRSACGSAHPNAKFTEDDARAIRAEFALRKTTQRALAKRYGVSQTAIHFVTSEKHWRHA